MTDSLELRGRILVADDDKPLGRLFKAVLARQGHEVEVVTDGEAAKQSLSSGRFDLMLVDLTMAPTGGLEILRHAGAVCPGTPVVIVTGHASVESAVEALRRGAHDYLIKPVQNEQLIRLVGRVLEMKQMEVDQRRTGEALSVEKRRHKSLVQDMKARHALDRFCGSSPRMSEVRSLVEEVIRSDSTVLILGESGTGKSLLARTIHFNSDRAEAPFIETNCAIYSEGMLMSELFGHESGAFTGAHRQKKGRFELAEGGTVFLDEIGDFPGAAQVALLRFLQERRFERVGGEETIDANVRVIAATNRDLADRIKDGSFRADLFYRLNVIPVTLPPLRERPEDIARLAEDLLESCAARLGRQIKAFAPDAIEALTRYAWPGNIREMENAIERAVLLTHDEVVTSRHLPRGEAAAVSVTCPSTSLQENEKSHLLRVLEQSRWNKKRAAAMLGINRSSLYSKLRRFGLMEAGAHEQAAAAAGAGAVSNAPTPKAHTAPECADPPHRSRA